jgi:hypothetical protein
MTSKIKTSLITASLIVVASAFTGCGGGSDDTPAPVTSTTINAPQDGLIVKIPAGGLQLKYTNRICSSNTDLTVGSGKYALNVANFTCDSGSASFTEAYSLKVMPGATVDTDGDGAYNATNDTKPLDIEIKAKSTDTFPSVLTTLREVATEQGNTALATSLANVGAESPVALLASKPQLYAVSQMVVKAIKEAAAAGITPAVAAANIAKLDNNSKGITAIDLSSTTAPTITTTTATTANTFLNTNAITALTGIVKATATTTGVTSAQIQATLVKEVEAKNVDLTTLITNVNTALSTASSTTVNLNTNVAVTSTVTAAITAANTAINTANSTINNYDSKAKLTVNLISVKIGSHTYMGTSNDFNITKTSAQKVASTDNVVIALSAIGDNNFALTNGTLVAKITNTIGTQETLTLTIEGVSITTDSVGKLSATIANGSKVNLESTYNGISNRTATLSKAVTTTDLSFSIDTLIAAIYEGQMATLKSEIITTLTKAGTYTLSVGLSGIDISAVTNLTNLTTEGYKGFTGTVNVQAQ